MTIAAVFDKKFFRFILVGTINVIVGSAIMFFLFNALHCSYWFSSASNYILTSILSFFLNKYFTFEVKQWSIFMVIAFIATILFSYLIAYGIAKPLMNVLLKDSSQRIRENVALFTGMCMFTIINYLGQRLIVFKRKENEKIFHS